MSSLREIRSVVQQTAEAIKDVLKIDVEIVDHEMVRLAATGQYHDQCGQVMVEGFVYQYVLETGNTVVIENPGHNELCKPCPRQGHCTEDAEMAAPIMASGHPVGVIGLVSFNAEQTHRLLSNREWMLAFIEKMAELIVGAIPDCSDTQCEEQHKSLNLDNLERETILKALAEVAGTSRSKEKAAEILGISRATLYRKLKEYNI